MKMQTHGQKASSYVEMSNKPKKKKTVGHRNHYKVENQDKNVGIKNTGGTHLRFKHDIVIEVPSF